MFSKVLIANRGEIAVRIIRACKEMGIQTVAVFSEADRDALHVSLADESYCIGSAMVRDSYLNMNALISLAAAVGAEAIHPGYGLLSENVKFAKLCEQCNIRFIGPTSEVIQNMGDKEAAKRTMRNAGVPVIPGCDKVRDIAHGKEEAELIGYPLLIKARAGGGGRGIRLVKSVNEFDSAFMAASSEALSAFGDGIVYLEKFISPAKHIEMQIMCDNFSNVVCLGERECSVQRKNQKLIEESPSPVISNDIRNQLIEVATKAAKAVNYTGVGTIEFLLDKDKNFYFMEMNTRLQVEHPVTEMTTGIDIVQWQIRVAAGIKLPFKQKDIELKGHAIECRINAENPMENYRPSCGKITLLHVPGGPWVRFDTAVYQDYFVPPYYDSMIGKLIVHAATREEAIRKMRAALCELVIEGIEHNSELHMDILSDKIFKSGDYTIDFLEKRKR
ncbi:MAG: acetyl-CoA carboxylase biotin carboxylase subunit [Clostridiales bacterium]|nr:acetyl-CoA carboxylase biotin carboxylase subunit [Clostridiales bacterium]